MTTEIEDLASFVKGFARAALHFPAVWRGFTQGSKAKVKVKVDFWWMGAVYSFYRNLIGC